MFEADAHFEMNYMMDKSAKGHNMNEVTIEEVPLKITVGVTVSLCGLFLWFVPLSKTYSNLIKID